MDDRSDLREIRRMLDRINDRMEGLEERMESLAQNEGRSLGAEEGIAADGFRLDLGNKGFDPGDNPFGLASADTDNVEAKAESKDDSEPKDCEPEDPEPKGTVGSGGKKKLAFVLELAGWSISALVLSGAVFYMGYEFGAMNHGIEASNEVKAKSSAGSRSWEKWSPREPAPEPEPVPLSDPPPFPEPKPRLVYDEPPPEPEDLTRKERERILLELLVERYEASKMEKHGNGSSSTETKE